MKHCLLVFAAVVALAIGVPASAQYMFIDVNGDGQCTSTDVLTPSTSTVDVWLSTNLNADGNPAVCASGENMTINSYTFILSAVGGTVTYAPDTDGAGDAGGPWYDNMGFTIAANPHPNGVGTAGNDIWVARASGSISAPGTYKLGTLDIASASAGARLEIHPTSTIDGSAITSFGSACQGQDFDNTMKLPTDWQDICGTASQTPATETTWGKIKNMYQE